MPKEMTHWTFANNAFLRLPDRYELHRIIKENYRAFLAGAVTMDTGFYTLYGKYKPLIFQRSGMLHNPGPEGYAAVYRILSSINNLNEREETLTAYIAGVLTHIHADAAFHPLVFYFSGTSPPKKTRDMDLPRVRHQIIETYLDLYYKNDVPKEGTTFASLTGKRGITKDELVQCMEALYMKGVPDREEIPPEARKKAFSASIHSHQYVQALFDIPFLRFVFQFIPMKLNMGALPFTSMFYPYHIPPAQKLFAGPVSYRHPVTGKWFETTVVDLEKIAVEGAFRALCDLEKWVLDEKPKSPVFSHRGPSPTTGDVFGNMGDMRYFDLKKNIFDIIFPE